jgi:hypothetical protein
MPNLSWKHLAIRVKLSSLVVCMFMRHLGSSSLQLLFYVNDQPRFLIEARQPPS